MSASNAARAALESRAQLVEYSAAANPVLPAIPALAFPASLHLSGESRVVHLDLSGALGHTAGPATSPNLLASFLRIKGGESVSTSANATSNAFYVIRGAGSSSSAHGEVQWSQGDLFVLPATTGEVRHASTADADSSLYAISDEPLLRYLGVTASERRFEPTLYTNVILRAAVEAIRHQPGAEHRNRMDVLLANETTIGETKTLTHVLWALLNVLPAKTKQPPHRHNSVALDLAISAAPGLVYTLAGPELDEEGWVRDPVRLDWNAGAMFVTPPGWWHSHHNESEEEAWVLPMQDAGLYTRQRTLDIRFSPATETRQ